MEGRAGTGWIVPARLPVRRLRHDGDAVARRGRDRIVGRQAQVRRQRVEVDGAAEAVGAVLQLGEAVAAVGQERVDRDPVASRPDRRSTPLILIVAGVHARAERPGRRSTCT